MAMTGAQLAQDCPLKTAKVYLARAVDFDAREPTVGYYLRTYALNVMMAAPRDASTKKFLMTLLDYCEKEKGRLAPDLAAADGRMIVTTAALTLFTMADDLERRTCQASEKVLKLFYTSTILFEASAQFNEGKMDPFAMEKHKYARCIAGMMKKALEGGAPYVSPNGPPQQATDDAAAAYDALPPVPPVPPTPAQFAYQPQPAVPSASAYPQPQPQTQYAPQQPPQQQYSAQQPQQTYYAAYIAIAAPAPLICEAVSAPKIVMAVPMNAPRRLTLEELIKTVAAHPVRTSPRIDALVQQLRGCDMATADSSLLMKLADQLQLHDVVQVQTDTFYSAAELYMQALRRNPSLGKAYARLADIARSTLRSFTFPDGVERAPNDILKLGFDHDPNNGWLYYVTGDCYNNAKDRYTVNGVVYNQMELWTEALWLSPDVPCYSRLAYQLKNADDTWRLKDGRVLTKKQLLAENLARDQIGASAINHCTLAHLLKPDEVIMIGEAPADAISLLIDAIRIEPEDASTYEKLADRLPKGKTVVLHDGRTVNSLHLCNLGLQQQPADPSGLMTSLAAFMTAGDTHVLPDGRVISHIDVCREAVRLSPTSAVTWRVFGGALSKNDTVTMSDGRVVTKVTALLEAVRLAPTNSTGFNSLGVALPKGARVRLLDGRDMGQRELFWEAIRLNPANKTACKNLEMCLHPGEMLQLPDGSVVTKELVLRS